jgi:predicted histone-like DNA-binding protein
MELYYDYYKNPIPKDTNRKQRLHARAVTSETVDLETMAENLQHRSTVTTGDVKAVVTLLCQEMVNQLSSGNRVHIDGLGFFHLTLTCPPVRTPNEKRAESVKVKSVAFRPDIQFKEEIKSLKVKRVEEKNHSKDYSDAEIEERLAAYFLTHPYIKSREFQALCGLTSSTATRRLRNLVASGKLKTTGHPKFPLYEPANVK